MKTRGHDHAPGLHEALLDHGFVPDETESIMIGEAPGLAVDVGLPPEVTLRRVTEEADVRAMVAMQAEVFGDDDGAQMADAVVSRLARGEETWSCGSPRPRGRSSAPGGSSRWPAPTSPASGVAPRGRSGAAVASTAP